MGKKKNKNTGLKVAVGAAIAGVGGYVAGILTAPKSGKETRDNLGDKTIDLKNEATGQLQELENELGELVKTTKTKTIALSAQARDEFNEAVMKAKDAQNKATYVLKAVRAGEASDPELNKAVKQAKQAKKNLSKFLKG